MKPDKPRSVKKIVYGICVIFIILILPRVLGEYWLEVANLAMMTSISVLGLSIIFGYCGQGSFCHATFVGIGGYASAILVTKLGLPVWISMIGALLVPAIFALVIGLPTLRLTGAYFAIATMCFAVIFTVIVWNWEGLTGGYIGILGVPSFEPEAFFEDGRKWFYLIFIFLAGSYYILKRIVNSRMGRAMVAIRENELLAGSMGVNTAKYKIFALLVGAVFAGLGGGLTVHYLHMISPEFINMSQSFMLVMYVVVGGMSSLLGPVFATLLFSFLSEFLRATNYFQMIIFGVVLLVVIMYVPGGIAELYTSSVKRLGNIVKKGKGRAKIA